MTFRELRRRLPGRRVVSALACLGPALGASGPVWAGEPIAVSITDRGCEPVALKVPAGRTTFRIKNNSRRAVEWEILKGVTVVEERENILPGFTQTVTATLESGSYEITCGRTANPRGTLQVGAAEDGATGARAEAPDLAGPVAEYKAFVVVEVEALSQATGAFTAAIREGRLEDAKRLYAPARVHYERIEPVAELFNDLDGSMDAREDDFEKRAEDPGFLGFHRLEKGLFADASVAGLAPVADRPMADVLALRTRVATLTIPPKTMVGGAASLLEEVAAKKISGEEDRYSGTDLSDFQANVEGARKIVALLDPALARRNSGLGGKVQGNFAKVDAVLSKYRTADGGFLGYDKLSREDRNLLRGPVTALAEDLSTLRGALGVD